MVRYFRNILKNPKSIRQKNLELLQQDSVDQVLQILKKSLKDSQEKDYHSDVDLKEKIQKKINIESIKNKMKSGNYLNDMESRLVGVIRI